MDPHQSDTSAAITSWLVRWREGEEEALPHLATLVYAELHRLAAALLRQEREGHTLQPTALVHELYLNLPAARLVDWRCRAQFFSLVARMMRNILVDHARRRNAEKRGAGVTVLLGDKGEEPGYAPDILSVDEALSRFEKRFPRQAQVLELRFFGGLTAEETAEAMNTAGPAISLRTIERDWKFAKAWLQNELG